MTGLSPLLFAIIDTSAPYWAYGFPAAVSSVFGADFIFSSGSLFVAKVAKPEEQSVAGGLFNTLTAVREASHSGKRMDHRIVWFDVSRLEHQ